MFRIDRAGALAAFNDYASGYELGDVKIRLKYDHMLRVASRCAAIAESERECELPTDLAWLIGLVHDIGRFEQVRRYGTFVDSKSIDHAALSAELLFGERRMIDLFTNDRSFDDVICFAVTNHSSYRIPETEDILHITAARALRDADKLDIFRVMNETPLEEIYDVSTEELSHACITDSVLQCFHERHAVQRALKRTPIDNLVGHICLYFELEYDASKRMARDEGYLAGMLDYRSSNPDTQEKFEMMRREIMSFVRVYESEICSGCRDYLDFSRMHGINWDFIDITENVTNLREFLSLRDECSVFDQIKKEGRIGIPAFVCGDTVTLNLMEALTYDGSIVKFRDIYLAGGCFWGTEKAIGLLKGVADTEVGYANGTVRNPSYEQVCSGRTGACEAVKVKYNPEITPLETIIEALFMMIDPTQEDGQGADIGTQYRTGIYYTRPEDEAVVRECLDKERAKHSEFHVEMGPLENFYSAEEYHQDYLEKNPMGYCHVGIAEFRAISELNDK